MVSEHGGGGLTVGQDNFSVFFNLNDFVSMILKQIAPN